jgi:uncharacterized membrane protein YuzA (DUF378 family)
VLLVVGNFAAAVFGLDLGQTNVVTRLAYGQVGLSAAYVTTKTRALPRRCAVRFVRARPRDSFLTFAYPV